MAIKNGFLASADEVIALQKYALISAGQNFINSMKVASPNTDYLFIKGRNFTCNAGNVTVTDNSGGTYCLKYFCNFSDSFATTGCWCDISPTQYLGYLNVCGVSCERINYACVCIAGTLLSCGRYSGGTNPTRICLKGCRPYADCYKIIVEGRTNKSSSDAWDSCHYISLGNCCIYFLCCGDSHSDIVLSCATYEFRRIAGTNNYCYLCNDSLICCISPVMTGGVSYTVYLQVSTCTNKCSCAELSAFCLLECSTENNSYILTATNTFPENLDFAIVTSSKIESGENLRYCLLCSDDTCLCSNLCVDTLYDVESFCLCEYKLKFYNCLQEITPSGIGLKGYAMTGVSRCP
jgi:hypothetical protein